MSRQSDVLRAAAAQIDVVPFDAEANAAKHEEMIGRARQEGADLVVFPELSLAGYNVGARSYEAAISRDDPLLSELAAIAQDISAVVGFVEEGYAAQFFNSAAVLRDGEVVFVHRKLNLANYGALEEGKFFAQGRYIEPFPLHGSFSGAVLTCADMWNPALVHLAALHGATLLVSPTASSHDAVSRAFSNPRGWDTVLRFYAMIYGLPIVMANRVGTEGGLEFWGGSRIVDANGDVVASAGWVSEDLILTDIDYLDVRRSRFELPTVRDSNLSLVQREIDRLSGLLGVPGELGR